MIEMVLFLWCFLELASSIRHMPRDATTGREHTLFNPFQVDMPTI